MADKKKKKDGLGIGGRVLSFQFGQEAAQGHPSAISLFKARKGAQRLSSMKMFKPGALSKGLRGGALGVIQGEVLEGKAKKAIKHGKTAVRVGKRVLEMFKKKEK